MVTPVGTLPREDAFAFGWGSKAHQGEITADSIEGEITEFIIQLKCD